MAKFERKTLDFLKVILLIIYKLVFNVVTTTIVDFLQMGVFGLGFVWFG